LKEGNTMSINSRSYVLAGSLIPGIIAIGAGCSNRSRATERTIKPESLPRIATIEPRYQSYNVEIAEVVGGNFWKPYTAQSIAQMTKPGGAATGSGVVGEDTTMFQARAPVDLTNPRLRKLATALGPAYVRVSGSWMNSVYFDDSDSPAPSKAPKGFQGVLTRSQWKGVVDFAHAVNAKLVTSFAVSAGVRDARGTWTPVQAKRLLAYTKTVGGDIAAAEMFNEPDMPVYGGAPAGYSAANYARDFAVFLPFARSVAPPMKVVGPGSVGEGVLMPLMGGAGLASGLVKTEDMLSATPKPEFDIYSYHFYGAASIRCASMGAGAQTTADSALTEQWLARTDKSYAFYVGLRDRFQPGKAVWITETADAACGGNPWASTFLDSFRYVDQMGRLARRGVSVIFHNTLASSEYGLLDQNTFAPRPNYWAGLLWHRLMGPTVLDAGASRSGLHRYAQCMADHPGGVTLLAINTSRTQPDSIAIGKSADRYTLTAHKLEDTKVLLNGKPLALRSNDDLPALDGVRVDAGRVDLPPASITFLAMKEAGSASCC
jgi:heparanase